jgi:hypothetical protein
LTGLLPASRQYVKTHQVCLTLSNAAEHLQAALDLREEMVEGKTPEGLFQIVFIGYKAMLRFGSNIVLFVRVSK